MGLCPVSASKAVSRSRSSARVVFHVRRMREKIAVEFKIHHAGQGERLAAQGGKEVLRLRFSGALKAEKVITARGDARRRRAPRVFQKALVHVGAALRGLDEGKAHALPRERLPVDRSLIVGNVHAPDGKIRPRGRVEFYRPAQHQRREERQKQAQRAQGDEKAANAAGRGPCLRGHLRRAPSARPPWPRRRGCPSGSASARLPPRCSPGGGHGGCS